VRRQGQRAARGSLHDSRLTPHQQRQKRRESPCAFNRIKERNMIAGQGHTPEPQRKTVSVVGPIMTCASILMIDDSDDQIVRAPRTTDAIGMTMRDVFGNLGSLPDDMRRLLQRLDQSGVKNS
jgi:hypothetical protein